MDTTTSNNEIHKLNLLLLLAMKMIKIIDCMRKKNPYTYYYNRTEDMLLY